MTLPARKPGSDAARASVKLGPDGRDVRVHARALGGIAVPPRPPSAADVVSGAALWQVHAGDPRSRVIVHVPHASRRIPARERARIVLDDAALERELDAITDAHTDWLALAAAATAAMRPWLFVNGASRLLVDPERFPDEREEMLERGMGAVYTHTTTREVLREADAPDDARLIDTYSRPYAAAFEQLTTERLAAVGRVCIVDVHSYPLDALP